MFLSERIVRTVTFFFPRSGICAFSNLRTRGFRKSACGVFHEN